MKKLIAMMLCLLVSTSLSAAADMFLKIDGVEGESQVAGHEGEIDILSFGFNVFDPGGDSECTEGMTISKFVDRSTAPIVDALASRRPFSEAVLFVTLAGDPPREYFKLTMTDIFVTSYKVGGAGGEERLVDVMRLIFAAMKGEYTEFDEQGSPRRTNEFNIAPDVCTGNIFKNGFEIR